MKGIAQSQYPRLCYKVPSDKKYFEQGRFTVHDHNFFGWSHSVANVLSVIREFNPTMKNPMSDYLLGYMKIDFANATYHKGTLTIVDDDLVTIIGDKNLLHFFSLAFAANQLKLEVVKDDWRNRFSVADRIIERDDAVETVEWQPHNNWEDAQTKSRAVKVTAVDGTTYIVLPHSHYEELGMLQVYQNGSSLYHYETFNHSGESIRLTPVQTTLRLKEERASSLLRCYQYIETGESRPFSNSIIVLLGAVREEYDGNWLIGWDTPIELAFPEISPLEAHFDFKSGVYRVTFHPRDYFTIKSALEQVKRVFLKNGLIFKTVPPARISL